MCGIAGILRFDGRPVDRTDVVALTDALAHRGRDHAAAMCGDGTTPALSAYAGVGLGHRRLSIIDLSDEASQPMGTFDGQLWITYNGELYNYAELRDQLRALGCRFRTHSDTEVVLEAYRVWGDECLRRFNGIFAFALWDEARHELFCARDPIGVKPLYFTLDTKAFSFASEGAALARRRSDLDRDALTAYLLSMYVPGHLSLFSGVRKLMPGSFMKVRRNGETVTARYWTLSITDPVLEAPDASARRMRALLDTAVRSQLVSDVPVGALLSGGFDSGMVVAAAAHASTSLHTYSVGFDDGVQFNELPIARAMAQRYGTRHHERIIRSGEVLQLLERAIASMSEPAADSAIVPTFCLSEMAAADGVKVLLSGTGGDEVFAGYSRYIGHTALRRVLLSAPDHIRRLVGAMLAGRPSLGARLRHRSLDMMMNTGGSSRLAAAVAGDGFAAYLEWLAANIFPRIPASVDQLHQHMQFDLHVYLPDLLLMLLDQLTMAHTIEGRVPLLDTALIEASFALPSSAHARSDRTKLLMRRMAEGVLDQRTLAAPKQGFSGPVRKWIDDNRAVFEERTRAVRDVPFCDRVPVDELWSNSRRMQDIRWPGEVFSLFVLSTWYHGRAGV